MLGSHISTSPNLSLFEKGLDIPGLMLKVTKYCDCNTGKYIHFSFFWFKDLSSAFSEQSVIYDWKKFPDLILLQTALNATWEHKWGLETTRLKKRRLRGLQFGKRGFDSTTWG